VVGKHIGAVIGIRNNGDVGFNVSAIQGNLALIHEPAENVRVEIERPTLARLLARLLALRTPRLDAHSRYAIRSFSRS
jgi:hypothetical protein